MSRHCRRNRCLVRASLAALAALLSACGDDNEAPASEVVPAASSGEEAPPAPAEAPAAAPAAGAVTIVPGESIGPIRLGMARAEVDALDVLAPHPQYSAMTIPYTVYYDDQGAVHQLDGSFTHAPGDIRVGDVVIPRNAGWDQAKSLLADCVDDEPAVGGTTSRCRNGGVLLQIGSGNVDELWIRIERRAD